jgi:hypothetical protein
MKRVHKIGVMGASMLLLTSVGLAIGDDGKERPDMVNLSTSLTMEEAMKNATSRIPGKVLEAELEHEDGKAIYEVEILNASGETHEVKIDAHSGKILSSNVDDQETHETDLSDNEAEKS